MYRLFVKASQNNCPWCSSNNFISSPLFDSFSSSGLKSWFKYVIMSFTIFFESCILYLTPWGDQLKCSWMLVNTTLLKRLLIVMHPFRPSSITAIEPWDSSNKKWPPVSKNTCFRWSIVKFLPASLLSMNTSHSPLTI